MRFLPRGFILLGLFLLWSARAEAHETWLAPSAFVNAAGQPVVLNLTSGMDFPRLDYAIRPERVAVARGRIGSERFELHPGQQGKHALRFEQIFTHPGLATFWVVLKPKALDLSDAKVAEYFQEIDAPPAVREAWVRQRGHRPWHETYTKCAKTFLRLGVSGPVSGWEQPTGLPLELVPQESPTGWKVGATVHLQLLEQGKPLSAIAAGLIVEGSNQRVFQTTDANGRCSFHLPRAGRALFFAVHLQPHGSEWASNFTTLTAQIAP